LGIVGKVAPDGLDHRPKIAQIVFFVVFFGSIHDYSP
jgi:hypothetical protein